jgi:hypothetical protein
MTVDAGKVALWGKTYPKVAYRAIIGVFEDHVVFSAFEILCYDIELGTPFAG